MLREKLRLILRGAAVLIVSVPVTAVAVTGERVAFESPRGLTEACVALTPVPGGMYSDADRSEEASLCAIDFYSGDYALCPKTFSTSPGTLIYPLSGGPYAGRAAEFEAGHCVAGHIELKGVAASPVSFKMTMNAPDTSATFAPAAWLYYHLSRYFRTDVYVPVSVYRSMDRKTHLERVSKRGLEASGRGGSSAMNRAGWRRLVAGDQDPDTYRPSAELYTPDGAIFGALLQPSGRRYGAELNGTRRSGWGAGQNRDFQETAPFLALRHDAPLAQAIEHGTQTAARDPELRKAMGDTPSSVQMVFWMKELTEIVILDYILSQQDRIGNIDYRNFWYWHQDGEARRLPAVDGTPPARIAAHDPVLLRRTYLNDNDAGGRVPYANFAKTTGMLEKLRHISPETYSRLLALATDFEEQGELYSWLQETFGLSDQQFDQIVTNTRLAAETLHDSCVHGRLRFSLDPEEMLIHGSTDETEIACHDN